MYLEYDWAFDLYRPRLGDVFTSIRGVLSFPNLECAKFALDRAGLKLGRKTDTRTWEIISK
jgi:hypothetical protein